MTSDERTAAFFSAPTEEVDRRKEDRIAHLRRQRRTLLTFARAQCKRIRQELNNLGAKS